ncbi:MAG: transketolase [Acidimicrobiia bacterium]|nr:transketolase [Acidimicrobiia bacterium]
MSEQDLEQKGVDVIRGLSMDAVQKANSGHPGTPMALAPLAHVLWTRIMNYDASDPDWVDRDRFVLSCGHASMLLYSMLHLTGYEVSLHDLEQFRQWGSITPGHPEIHDTPGVEVTTGPLGQGFAMSVGMAMAERRLRAQFGSTVCDHHIFVMASDGDFMEGVSHEAASLAGHLDLGKLVVVYDDNHITIDGPTELAYTDNVPERFAAYGWDVVEIGEVANDLGALEAGVRRGMENEHHPSLVVLRSHIGYPSPNFTDTAAAHGSPLGEDEVKRVKEILGLPPDEHFYVPDDVAEMYRAAGSRGAAVREQHTVQVREWRESDADRTARYDACLATTGLPGWEKQLPVWKPGDGPIATRSSMADTLSAVVDVVPPMLSGAADLLGNTGTKITGAEAVTREEFTGRLVHYGIREFGMAAAMNGMAASGGVLPFGGTFFIFSDYMRAAVRLAALQGTKVGFIWSHDSVGLGEDGPTHQPIEQLASLRAMPGLTVIRPADANESVQAFRVHVEGDGPTGIVLTRQKLPVLEGSAERAVEGVSLGAYTLVDEDAAAPELILLGTGSEVSLCVEAHGALTKQGHAVRVVSMPSWELFAAATPEYRDSVLPPGTPTLAVEAGATFGWDRYADDVIGIDRFGASAPGATVMKELGFTPENVAQRAEDLLGAI